MYRSLYRQTNRLDGWIGIQTDRQTEQSFLYKPRPLQMHCTRKINRQTDRQTNNMEWV